MITIFEGIDNVGKTTQINLLNVELFKRGYINHILHYSAIKGVSNNESKIYSKELYESMFDILYESTSNIIKNNISFILDRSHIGEAVYSPLYREYNGDYVFSIEKLNKHFKSNFWSKFYLILLIDDPINVISREDGKSFSTDINTKYKEIELFENAVKKSHINNKLTININGLSIEDVQEKINKFIFEGK